MDYASGVLFRVPLDRGRPLLCEREVCPNPNWPPIVASKKEVVVDIHVVDTLSIVEGQENKAGLLVVWWRF